MNLRDLRLRLLALARPNRVERELDEELAFHIEREAQKLIDEGVRPEDARLKARARFGSTTVIADDCRDERGTAFVDNAVRDVQYALRSFRRAPLVALTIVATVSIGLGVVAVIFTILNTFLFRIDAVPDINEIYAVERPRLPDDVRSLLLRPQYEALRQETSIFTDAYAAIPDIDLRVDGRMMAAVLVSGHFFDVVRVKPAMGRVLTAADEASGGNPVIVLSDKGWRRHFKRDPGVLGRRVLVNSAPFEIVGVMPAGFRGLEVSGPDFWAPLSLLGQFRPFHRGKEDSVGVEIIGRLKPGLSAASARAQLAAWDSNRPQPAASDRRSATIELLPRRGTIPQPMEALIIFTPLFLAFGLILMIGCANVANLLLARGVARQREIGIRLSLGASRPRIVRQLMTESALLALVAAGGGYLVSRIALEGVVYWVMRTMPQDIGDVNLNVPASDWRVALFLVTAAMAATALFALMPALQSTRVDPVRTLRGELVKDARPSRARNALIGVQVFASTVLLISAAIFLRSAMASAGYDPGFRTADTVMIELNRDQTRAAMLQQIAAEPTITAYAAQRPSMLDQRAGFAETDRGKTAVGYKFVSGSYFDVMGVPILRGRSFTAAERTEDPVVVVSESMARALWPNQDAVGQTFRLEPDMSSATQPKDEPALQTRVVTVVGVSRDIVGFRFARQHGPGVFLPTGADVPHTDLIARVSGDPDLARQTLLDHLTRVDPSMGMILTMRTVARLESFFLSVAFWVALILGSMALLLTVSGLFSVLSYLVEQRTKEIGVRMALGASSQAVTRLMLSQTARPVLYGLAAGAGVAVTFATVLLATDLGAFIGPIVHVTDPIAYAISLLVIIAACALAASIPARRAARVDPMRSLRVE